MHQDLHSRSRLAAYEAKVAVIQKLGEQPSKVLSLLKTEMDFLQRRLNEAQGCRGEFLQLVRQVKQLAGE